MSLLYVSVYLEKDIFILVCYAIWPYSLSYPYYLHIKLVITFFLW